MPKEGAKTVFKTVAQNNRGAFVENKANLGPPWTEVKRVPLLGQIVGQLHLAKTVLCRRLPTIPKVGLTGIVNSSGATKVNKGKGLFTIPRVALPTIYTSLSFTPGGKLHPPANVAVGVNSVLPLALRLVQNCPRVSYEPWANSVRVLGELGELVTNGYKRKLCNNE